VDNRRPLRERRQADHALASSNLAFPWSRVGREPVCTGLPNGDTEIGRFLAEAMKKVGNEGVITVEEAKSLETELDVVEGMQFDRGDISPCFITNAYKMRVEMEDPYIFINEKKLALCRSSCRCSKRRFRPSSRFSSSPRMWKARPSLFS
jgi:chaperonin GroEL (HSP60 family)